MQLDFHYYATYCLARAAGIKKSAAQIIAYSCQFVDDSTTQRINEHEDGSNFLAIATAHHPIDLKENLDHDDQRQVWVPFHFLPGGKGKTFTEKMICQKNSSIAKEMVNYNIKQNDLIFYLELLGITAHVYSDTFAHFGFSGISSRRNRVIGDSIRIEQSSEMIKQILGKKLARFFEKYGEQGGLIKNIRSLMSFTGEIGSGALGHGAVSIYPDQPFLKWSYEYEYKSMTKLKRIYRNNQKDYFEACQELYNIFNKVAILNNNLFDSNTLKPFKEISFFIKEILSTEGKKYDRAEVWKKYAKDGKLYNKKEKIPKYDPNKWEDQKKNFHNLTKSKNIARLNAYKFYQAASFHKRFVLKELLPKNGIIVV